MLTLPFGAIGWEVLDRIRIGEDFALSPHGLGIAVGYLAGSWVMFHEAPKRGISEDKVGSLVFWALVGAIVGARAFYVLGHLSEFEGLADMLAVYRGGISLIGGIFGAIIFAYPVMRKHRLPFLVVMDSAAIGLALGIVIGRVGDLIIGDHLGTPTSWALAFQYRGGTLAGYNCTPTLELCRATLFGGQAQQITPQGAILRDPGGDVLRGVGVHQTALYDFLGTMGLVLLLLYLNRTARRPGILIATFAIWYGSQRIITDFLRVDKTWFGLTGSQWASVATVLVCVAALVRFALKPSPAPSGALPPGGGTGTDIGTPSSDDAPASPSPGARAVREAESTRDPSPPT